MIPDIMVNNDKYYDRIPLMSTYSNLSALFHKYIYSRNVNPAPSELYAKHIMNKSLLRMVLLCIPFLGNVVVYIYDKMKPKSEVQKIFEQHRDDVGARYKALAAYVDQQKIALECLLDDPYISFEDIKIIAGKITYLNLRDRFTQLEAEEILKLCSAGVETVVLENSLVEVIPQLNSCESLSCSFCPNLSSIETLPVCRELNIVECHHLRLLNSLPTELLKVIQDRRRSSYHYPDTSAEKSLLTSIFALCSSAQSRLETLNLQGFSCSGELKNLSNVNKLVLTDSSFPTAIEKGDFKELVISFT